MSSIGGHITLKPIDENFLSNAEPTGSDYADPVQDLYAVTGNPLYS